MLGDQEAVPPPQRHQTPLPPISGHPQLTNKIVFVVSFVGNRGTFIRGYKAMIMDVEFLYHVGYIVTSVLGLFVHELFYSILVGEIQVVVVQAAWLLL